MQQGKAISQEGIKMQEMQTQQTTMIQPIQQMQQQQQKYGKRNKRRMDSLTEEMGNLNAHMYDFHEIIHHVGVPEYEGRGRP